MDWKVTAAAVTGLVILVTGGVLLATSNPMESGKAEGAIIQLSGSISATSGGLTSSALTPEKVRELNEKALEQGADVIIYEINSGGGTVVASKEIMREIESVEVPTVCRIRDVGASGAYLLSTGCDRIVADSASLTGSIGVRSSYLEYSGLLNKLGVEYVNITSGKYKEIGSRYSNITSRERKMLKQKAEAIHRQFLETVKEERNLTRSQVQTIKTGNIFLGKKAKELGLVDRLGGRMTAKKTAEDLVGRNVSFSEVQQGPQFGLLSLMGIDSMAGEMLSLVTETGTRVPFKASYGY
ncbi:MAG: signal peptide peptidase SppA [Candidatus Nanohaloarchaea archaeon]